MTTELTNKEKCLVVQMMLRQSPKIQKIPLEYKKAIQLYFQQTVYPNLTPKDIANINLDLDKFLENAETTMQKGLIKAMGKQGFASVLSKFGIGQKIDNDGEISDGLIKEMEHIIKSEIDEK